MDWEEEIAGAALELDGVPARYQSAVDGDPDGVVDFELQVLFHSGYVETNAQGVKVDDVVAQARGRRSALSDARAGGLLTVNGAVYVVRSKPRDDGRVYITLMLEGPIG